MEIRIKTLRIRNFKGCEDKTIEFNGKDADIYGDNATGKTTIADAWSWLLFDKNSQGDSKFDIKPYGVDSPEVEVEGTFLVDDRQVVLKKSLIEKVSTVRGKEDATKKADVKNYWIDDVPQSREMDYTAFVDSIISESTFKKLSNVKYFLDMETGEMRKLLISLGSDMSDMEVAGEDKDLVSFVEYMQSNNRTTDDITKITKQNITKFELEEKQISPRIDENRRAMPAECDYSKLEEGLAKGNGWLVEIDKRLSDSRARVAEIAAKHTTYLNLEKQMEDMKSAKLRELNEAKYKNIEQKGQLNGHAIKLKGEIDNLNQKKQIAEDGVKEISSVLAQLAEKYKDLASRKKKQAESVFTPIADGESECPNCGQSLPPDKINQINEDAQKIFESERAADISKLDRDIADVTVKGKEASAKKVQFELQIKDSTEQIEKLSVEHKAAESRIKIIEDQISGYIETKNIDLTGDPAYDALKTKADAIKQEVEEDPNTATEKLIEGKAKTQQQVDEIKTLLKGKQDRIDGEARITELTKRGKELTQLIADEKALQWKCEKFVEKQARMAEDGINGLFENLSFKLFEVQKNEGIKKVCIPMIHGVGYKDASHSEQIRAGMDILNAFQKKEGKFVPIFVDNAEAATYLREMNCQVIRLVVSEPDKQLRIEERR